MEFQLIFHPDIGISKESKCLYWIHTHDETGKIHIESPLIRKFTLGDFFDIWGQPLSNVQISSYSNQIGIRVYVDGKIYEGDPREIELSPFKRIILDTGPNYITTLPDYKFSPND